MSLSSYRPATICLECPEPCCKHVKHMPYLGEDSTAIFSSLLMGAFPLFGLNEDLREDIPLFALEWIVPAELSECLAYRNGLCTIYEDRPLSCRNFPVIGPDNRLHEFCHNKESFLNSPFIEPRFLSKAARLQSFLQKTLNAKGMSGLSNVIHEENPSSMPLLYNGLWALTLVSAEVDVQMAMGGQKELLKRLALMGYSEVTVLIPYSDYCISGQLEGLLVNLQYLELRLKQEGLLEDFFHLCREKAYFEIT